ncbi:hypothetical protein CH63R_10243 [Colletotrichum higginsianum IMI 349063]|uniref:Uncharacterized protein n=1 Tax=Colletotrichum higginsianum (strain IMI 349063) TaxID=759273 RepID=A0A1B7Y264_COLHI|nr:uncharacterized protein CH63R_10243 [Colletotrichum higginsianum IMI 349063]OBR06123.1 hypothetical protein CH63R_10243 [Colletotrichum higginsianum IMI 349063]
MCADRIARRKARTSRVPHPTTAASIHGTTPLPRCPSLGVGVWPKGCEKTQESPMQGGLPAAANNPAAASALQAAAWAASACMLVFMLADEFNRGHATAARAHIPARIVEHGNQLKGETDDAASPSQPAAQTERSERDATPPAPRQPHEPQTPRAARATGKPTHPKPRAS